MRQPKTSRHIPKCPGCGRECYCVGYKVEIPKKNQVRRWQAFREESRLRALRQRDQTARARYSSMRAKERQIKNLSMLEENRDRKRLINGLKKDVDAYWVSAR